MTKALLATAVAGVALVVVGCTTSGTPSSLSSALSSAATASSTSAVASSAASRASTSPTTAVRTTRATPPPPAATTSTPALTGVPLGLRGSDWTHIPTDRHVVALTFDAGGNDAGVAKILAALRAAGIPATFFMTGTWARLYPAEARTIGASYRLGDHSMTHPHFTSLSADQVSHEVLDAARSIRQATGVGPEPLFRFPYGDQNAGLIAQVNSLGFIPIRWTVDTLGWQGVQAGATTPHILQRVLGALTPGEIVLMHVGSTPQDGSTPDADALAQIIAALRARGYSFVSLDAMRG
jgi:peptidoglycan/xylan/chitin deacetylase (PgdA/CDA1 family)